MATVCRVQFEKGRRVLVTSDIHGHIRELEQVLRRASFTTDDILVIIGDIVEKGPESLRTLRRVMALCKTHTVYPLMGNVDEHFLNLILSDDPACHRAALARAIAFKGWWQSSLLHEMCGELGLTLDESADMEDILPRVRRAFAPELAFMNGLSTVLDARKMTFVHGGLPGEDLTRIALDDCHALLKCDNFSEGPLCFHKPVVVGHWPAPLYRARPDASPYFDEKRGILSIDGGCGIRGDGQLNLLIYPDGDADVRHFARVCADSLPKVIAREDQAGSASDHYIRWTNRRVEVLEKDERTALVRHLGCDMRVPADLVHSSSGEAWCEDITDRRLPVRAGDTLALVRAYGFGAYVKQGDESGWYFGAYDAPEQGV